MIIYIMVKKMQLDFDVVIIGAGVAGMTAAIYLKRAGINVAIIEKELYGGQINLASKVENYPGFIEVSGIELTKNIYEQIKKLDIPYINSEVISTKLDQDIKEIILRNKTVTCKRVIIATGRHSRKLKVEGINELVGKGISYCATCDGNLFKNKEVAVIGGGSSAFDEALYLSNICSKVYIINRTNNLRAEQIYIDRANKEEKIEIIYNSEIKQLHQKDGVLDSITINDTIDKDKTKNLNVKCCFTSIGYEPSSDIFESVNVDKNGYVIVDEDNKTNIDGVYAAGDIVKKKIFQLITAMNDGVIAAYSCISSLRKNK